MDTTKTSLVNYSKKFIVVSTILLGIGYLIFTGLLIEEAIRFGINRQANNYATAFIAAVLGIFYIWFGIKFLRSNDSWGKGGILSIDLFLVIMGIYMILGGMIIGWIVFILALISFISVLIHTIIMKD